MNQIRPYLLPLSQALLALLLLLLLVATPGCAHRRGSKGAFGQGAQGSGPSFPSSTDPWSTAATDGSAENVPLTGRPNDINFDSPSVKKNLLEPVFFAFDQYDVSGGELQKVQAAAQHLRQQPSSGVIIAGHTDATGTTEYNRNLGERRAIAIRDALLQQGVEAARIQTLSFGEDRPAQPGTSESDCSANRRAEFGVFESVSH